MFHILMRLLRSVGRLMSSIATPHWDAYEKWESRPFHNGDGI